MLDADGNETGETVPGIDTVFTWNSVSPRLGFAWKLNKSGHSVLKAHYGRYYRGVITGEFDDAAASVSGRYFFSGTYDDAGNPHGRRARLRQHQQAGGPELQEPLHRPVHRAVRAGAGARTWASSVGYIYKRGRNYGGWNDVGGQYETVGYVDTRAWTPAAATYRSIQLQNDPAERLFLLTNPSEMFTRYNGGTVLLTKRMSHHWQAVASLVVSKSTGRLGSSLSGPPKSQPEPAAAGHRFGQNPNDFINTDGRLVGDRPVIFKMQAVYQAAAGLPARASTSSTRRGGPGPPGPAPSDLVGLPTAILAEPISGDRRVPDWNILDMSVQKKIKLRARAGFALFAYLLNLTNSGVYERRAGAGSAPPRPSASARVHPAPPGDAGGQAQVLKGSTACLRPRTGTGTARSPPPRASPPG